MKKKLFTDINISRIDNFLDDHLKKTKNLSNGIPPISSVEISINGACNRRCFFCPRVDEEGYPNILESLDMKLFDELINDLESINYEGRIAFSGFCEPLLSKNKEIGTIDIPPCFNCPKILLISFFVTSNFLSLLGL